jgi:hypothetical protein
MAKGLLSLLGFCKADMAMMRAAQELAVALVPSVRIEIERGSLPDARAEARGYVHAKCTPLARRQVAQYFELTGTTSNHSRDDLRVEVTHRVVRMLVDEMLRGRKVAHEPRKAA